MADRSDQPDRSDRPDQLDQLDQLDEIATPLEPSAAELDRWMRACADFVAEHLAGLADAPSWDTEDAGAVAAGFDEPAPEAGSGLDQLLARLRPAFLKSFNTAGPGYLAFIPGGGVPAAALADFIACMTNRYVNVTAAAPVLARIESAVIDWLAALMGFPPGSGGILTSGGSLSNLAAIVAARSALLPEGDFLRGTLYYSRETHASLAKAARIAGFSSSNLREVPVDARLRAVPEAVERMIEQDRAAGRTPFFLVANAGTTNTGAVDPTPALADIASRHRMWLHSDAAYGGFFRAVPGGERLLPGLELCDSITLDPHKGLFLPYGTGCLLVKRPDALLRAHASAAHYLQDVVAARGRVNHTDLSPELSRDFRGLRIWLPIQLHGLAAFRAQLEEKLALARWAYERLRDVPELEMVDQPQLSIVAFAVRARPGRDADALGAELLRRVNARRRVFLSSTVIDGRYVLRICVLSFRTHRDRLAEATDALIEEAGRLAG
jgi:aromatic-L-amino-acid decarboxylase